MIFEIIDVIIGFSDFLSDFVIVDFVISSVRVGYFWFIRLPLSLSCAFKLTTQSLPDSSATCLSPSILLELSLQFLTQSIINVSVHGDIPEL